MKTKSLFPLVALLAFLLSTFRLPLSTFAQGSLTPPGAPAPTMKSLAQIEPRTPISSLPFTISQPGSYYLTTNLTGNPGGITIVASGVTLDLMGFELVGGTGSGIVVTGTRTNVAVRNGTVRNWSGHGVYTYSADNDQLERLRVSSNGGFGIATGLGSTASGCTAQGNSQDGIYAGLGSTISGCLSRGNGYAGINVESGCTVSGCTAEGNVLTGIFLANGCTASGCSAQDNIGNGIYVASGSTASGCSSGNNANGIVAEGGCHIKDCQVSGNNGDGIQVPSGSGGTTIRSCTARANIGDGIEVYNACLVVDNLCDSNGGGARAGIHVTGIANRIENNQSSSNGRGIGVDGTGNLIIRNSATHNTTNYVIAANNNVGVTVISPNSGAITGNTGGSGSGTTDPWANFSY